MTKVLWVVVGVLVILLGISGWFAYKLHNETQDLQAELVIKDTKIKGLQDREAAYMAQQEFAECNTSGVNLLLEQCYQRLAEVTGDLSSIQEPQYKYEGGSDEKAPSDASALDFLYKQLDGVR